MPVPDDPEVFDRFHRRLAGIESAVKDAPPMARRGARRRPSPRVLVPIMAALIVIAGAVGLPLLTGRTPTAMAPAAGASLDPMAASPNAPARLRIQVATKQLTEPSGVSLGGSLDSSKFRARISIAGGQEIATLDLSERAPADRIVPAGAYRVSAWGFTVGEQVGTGTRVTSPPFGECSTEVTLGPGRTTRITATFGVVGMACAFGAPDVSPSFAPSLASGFPIEGCEALDFSPTRCAAVVARARDGAVPPLRVEDVMAAALSRPGSDVFTTAGSFPIAKVRFTLAGGGSTTVDVRCGLPGYADRACNLNAAIAVRGGIDHDVPCAGPAPENPCATLPPDPRPASMRAAQPLLVATLDVPLARVGRYEIPVGVATLPDGILTERSASLVDPRPTTFWIDDGIAIEVRPDVPGRPPIGSIYRDPFDGPEPVHVFLVFDVVEVQPRAALQIRDLVVR